MWGVYGYPQFSCEIAAFLEGVRDLRLPFRERNHNGFTDDNQIEEFCPVVVSGLRERGEDIRRAYNNIGVPVIVVDYGYLKRVSGVATMQEGHWQVGVNRLGWIPPFQCPSDRFEELSIEIKPAQKWGSRIYVCGQHDGDPSHGLSKDQIKEWAKHQVEALRMVTQREIVWRPHPDSPFEIEGIETSRGPLDWPDVFCIVCINSNVGHEALINGVPVVAHHSAPYVELASSHVSESMRVPSIKTRRRYFERVAYAQWTLQEISEGKPQRWLIDQGLTKRNPS